MTEHHNVRSLPGVRVGDWGGGGGVGGGGQGGWDTDDTMTRAA